jgi:hypothetical protein
MLIINPDLVNVNLEFFIFSNFYLYYLTFKTGGFNNKQLFYDLNFFNYYVYSDIHLFKDLNDEQES